jgi:hypothetical protein
LHHGDEHEQSEDAEFVLAIATLRVDEVAQHVDGSHGSVSSITPRPSSRYVAVTLG